MFRYEVCMLSKQDVCKYSESIPCAPEVTGMCLFSLPSPLPPDELAELIYEASGQDISLAVLTQVPSPLVFLSGRMLFRVIPLLSFSHSCTFSVFALGNHGLPRDVCEDPTLSLCRNAQAENWAHHSGDGHRACL